MTAIQQTFGALLIASSIAACGGSSSSSTSDAGTTGGGAGGAVGSSGGAATSGAPNGNGGISASTGGSPAGGASGVGGGSAGGTSASSGGAATNTGGAIGSVPDGGLGLVRLPPVGVGFDYQLGGAYPPPAGVGIVSRDRTESPAPGLYNICYLNGFQIQPGEEGNWDADLILRDAGGNPIIDPDWNEMLLDVSTKEKRTRIAAVLAGWIAKCASDGFDAVEIDNLDTYSRSGGRLTQDNAVGLMALISKSAHGYGLALAQKNSTELLARKDEMFTDFAVAEECSRYSECGAYVSAYGDHVLMIEYRQGDFASGCQTYGATHSIVLRDLNLVPQGRPAYVFDGC